MAGRLLLSFCSDVCTEVSNVPDSRASEAGNEKTLAVWRERHRPDRISFLHLASEKPGLGVPDLNGIVPATGGQDPSVRREGNRGHVVIIALLPKLFAGLDIPNPSTLIAA